MATALPTIVGEFGGIQHLSWVVTGYVLASTVAGPLYGKLGDLYGRKLLLQVAIALFLLGSILCGLSGGMLQLVAFRILQGLGAGGLIVISFAAVADIIPPRDRGRYQGFVNAVFGIATVVGPLLGGFLVQHLSWRWIFYVNVPLGVCALGVIGAAFPRPLERRRHRIDVLGSVTLTLLLTSVVLASTLGGVTYAWGSSPILVLGGAAAVALVCFVAAERRAAEPILPLRIFLNRTFTLSSAISGTVAFGLFGVVTYLPLYLQVVKGLSPTRSGLQLAPMMGGILVVSIATGHLISRRGRYKAFPIAGTAISTLGFLLLSRVQGDSSLWALSGAMLVLGLGLGMVMQVLILAVQNAAGHAYVGVATSGLMLFRQVGGLVGVAALGALFAARLHRELADRLPPGVHVPRSPTPAAIARLPPAAHDPYVTAVDLALRPLFLAAVVVSALSFGLTWLLRDVPLGETAGLVEPAPREAT